MEVTRIGLDIAKSVFQVHGVDKHGKTVIGKQLRRAELLAFFARLPPCLVGMEACAGSHDWARRLRKLGHDARLMAAQFVSPYRKGGKTGKNDKTDAEAICEAVGRPSMRFVPVKSVDQQALLAVHRVRDSAVAQRTGLVNQMRGLLGEFGVVVPQGRERLQRALPGLLEEADNDLPALFRAVLAELAERLRELNERIGHYDDLIEAQAAVMPQARRLMHLPGIGPVSATALVASVGDARDFATARQFAAWLGLTPRQYSSGGKSRLAGISKRGDRYLRRLLIHGARAVLRTAAGKEDRVSRWAVALKARRGENVAAVALAAKQARRVWAMLAKEQDFCPAV
jgi:transposase